jgi:fumarate hydratase, class I
LDAIGGAAQFYARTVSKVPGVHLIDFGIPQAMWQHRAGDGRDARRTAASLSRLLE